MPTNNIINSKRWFFTKGLIAIGALGVSNSLLARSEDKDNHFKGAAAFVERANILFAEAAANRSAKGLGDLYTETAVILPPNLPLIRGAQNIEDFWQTMIESGLTQLQLTTIEVGSRSGMAYTVGEFVLSIAATDGTVTEDRGNYLTVLVKVPGRGWLFQNDAWSSSLPA